MAGQQVQAAIRARLLSSPQLVAIVGDRVYPRHLVDVGEPVYPCITLYQMDGQLAVWAPRTTDTQTWLVQIYSRVDVNELYEIYEWVSANLHEHKNLTSSPAVCFHQIREIWSNSGVHDAETNAWQLSIQYLTRASIHG